MRDLTSGFRAMRRDVISQFLHLLPNRFSWPPTSALAFAKAGYHVRFEPITVYKRAGGRSSQQLLRNGVKFSLIILRIATLFSPLRRADRLRRRAGLPGHQARGRPQRPPRPGRGHAPRHGFALLPV